MNFKNDIKNSNNEIRFCNEFKISQENVSNHSDFENDDRNSVESIEQFIDSNEELFDSNEDSTIIHDSSYKQDFGEIQPIYNIE